MKHSFSALGLDEGLISSLSKLGIINPSPIQYNFIRSSADETSIIFQSKSGTGKTVAFCIILLNKIISRSRAGSNDPGVFLENLSEFLKSWDPLFGDALVVVPTRELAYQIYLFFLSLTEFVPIIRSALLTGSTSLLKVISYLKDKAVNVVISTPGRLKTILKMKPTRAEIATNGIKSNHFLFKTNLLVLDEADMLLDEQFFEQTRYILSKISNPFVQVIAVSATFLKPQFKPFEDMVYEVDRKYIEKLKKNLARGSEEEALSCEPRLIYYVDHMIREGKAADLKGVAGWISSFERTFLKIILSPSYLNRVIDPVSADSHDESYHLTLDATDTVEEDLDTSSTSLVLNKVDFYLATVRDAPNIVMQIGLKMDVLVKVLASVKYDKCVIFCNQSHTRTQTYKLLQHLGYTCYVNSSRVAHTERVRMLYDLSSLHNVVILCTDIISRGIGFSNVDLVVNMDIPGSKEIFLHRSGRSGRFGSKGICVSICMETEVESYNYFQFALNFHSKSVEELYPSDLSIDVASLLMDSIQFEYLTKPVPDPATINKPTLVTRLFDLDAFKFKVKVFGFVTSREIRVFPLPEDTALMYIEQVRDELLLSIRYSQTTLFRAGGPKLKVCTFYPWQSEQDKNTPTHNLVQVLNYTLIVTIPGYELDRISTCNNSLIEVMSLADSGTGSNLNSQTQCNLFGFKCGSEDLESAVSSLRSLNCIINESALKSVIKSSNSECNIDFEDLSSSLDNLTLGSVSPLVKQFTQSLRTDLRPLIPLYMSVCQRLITKSNPEKELMGPHTAITHFLNTHVTHWNGLQS